MANGSATGHSNGNGHHDTDTNGHGTAPTSASALSGSAAYSSTSTISTAQGGTTTGNVTNISSGTGGSYGLRYSGEHRQVAPAFGPNLTTGDCLGSASGGFNNGIFGLSGGKTYVDEGCNARRDALLLLELGLGQEAVLRLCQQPKMAQALGEYCPPEYHNTQEDVDSGRWWAE